jgi:hypothetical protein
MDDFFDGPTMETISGPLVGGGVAQLGILGTRKFLPAKAKWAGAIGAALGVGASYLLMRKDRDKGIAGIAVALLIGIPRQIEDMLLPSKLSGSDTDLLGAYTSEMGAYTSEMGEGSPVEVLNSGSGGTGVIGAVVPEESMAGDLGADIEIQDAGAFGSTGF